MTLQAKVPRPRLRRNHINCAWIKSRPHGLASEFVRSVFRSYESAAAPVALFIGSAIFFDSVLDPLIADTHPSIPASQPVSLPA